MSYLNICVFSEERLFTAHANVGGEAIIDCYNTQWGVGDDAFYINIEFESIKPGSTSETIAKYNVRAGVCSFIATWTSDIQYKCYNVYGFMSLTLDNDVGFC